jgi:hypothetical protein
MELHAIENEPEYLNLQTELVWLQQWLIANRKRLIVIFEGRDTAGKGGAIMRFVRFINPRHYKIVALTKPTELESGQWYFQRYVQHLPDPGSIAFFDRSWYNRAVVEPVMGFCTEEQYQLFIKQVLQLEKCSRKMAYPSSNSGFPSTMRNRSDALKKGRPTRSSIGNSARRTCRPRTAGTTLPSTRKSCLPRLPPLTAHGLLFKDMTGTRLVWKRCGMSSTV